MYYIEKCQWWVNALIQIKNEKSFMRQVAQCYGIIIKFISLVNQRKPKKVSRFSSIICCYFKTGHIA